MKCFAFSLTALATSLLALSGCSGSSAPITSAFPTSQSFGPLTTRIVGAAQSPVTSSATNGANVTGIAGALVDRLTLNFQGPGTLSDTRIAYATNVFGNLDIFTVNADGSEGLRLTTETGDDDFPSWSPDGARIAYVSNQDGNSDIYLMDADGLNKINLTNHPASDRRPCWSPDGSKIAFESNRDGNNPTRLTNNSVPDQSPAWSPDGVKLAFTRSDHEIYVMNAMGGNQRKLTGNSGWIEGFPSWSPNGSKIAFQGDINSGAQPPNFEIYTIDADGTNQTRLTNDFASDTRPIWSPDSGRIAFVSDRSGNGEVYWMYAYGGPATNVTKTPTFGDFSPSWSGYLPRTPKTLVGTSGTGITVGSLGPAAAGFLYGQKGDTITSALVFDTSTTASRSAARVVSQSAPYNDQGSNLIFSITTSAGLASVTYATINESGVPGIPVSPTIPAGTTGALVSFNAATGLVSSVLPYAANRSASLQKVSGGNRTYTGNFTAVFDGEGKNLAPNGAHAVTLNEKTGTLVKFD